LNPDEENMRDSTIGCAKMRGQLSFKGFF